MARYAAGDVDGFDELFRRYEARIHAFFVRRTGSIERARDLYQELFLRIHRARDAYDPTRPFAPWLFQIAHRLLVDDRRRAYRSHEVSLEDREPRSALPGDEDRLADREHLSQLLDALSADERHVLLSSRVEGVGYLELAAQLGKSVDAVKKMASRATQRLRVGTRHIVAPIGYQSR
jgi:RNA polymerase sigma-70 factor (ECF subfamily)